MHCDGKERAFSAEIPDTTNNRMELTAAVKALEALEVPLPCHPRHDSRYLVDSIEKGWAKSWKARGWRRANGKTALNSDLWEHLLKPFGHTPVRFEWIAGHSGHPEKRTLRRLGRHTSKQFSALTENHKDPALP